MLEIDLKIKYLKRKEKVTFWIGLKTLEQKATHKNRKKIIKIINLQVKSI